MQIEAIIAEMERSGATVMTAGENIRILPPANYRPSDEVLARLKENKSEALAYLKARSTLPGGIRLVSWNLKEPPIAIEACAVVVDPTLFARTTLEQLRTALAQPRRWVGWSVPQLIDRLAQVGVLVTLESWGSGPT
jgi:hypothetical protein